jgi:N-acetylglucosaminyl-diphospho-decaprenol L-rhamnosyltransferase
MTLSIDVVVPTYQGLNLTESCLRHLELQTAPHTVIVSDNGSTDGTPELVRRDFPRARLVETGGNLGFPFTCNRGAEAGEGDVIVLLNNDVDCRPDFLEKLVAPLTTDAGIASVAAVLVQPGSGAIDSVGLTADPTLAGFPRHQGRPVADAAEPYPRLTGPSGGAGAYRRTAWEEVGGLDEGVRYYLEDLDLALRLASAGWRTAAAADALGVHRGSATMGQRSAWQRRQAAFSRGYFVRRYGLLRSGLAPRVLLTETVVVVADSLLARDLEAARGRLAGWRAAGARPRRPRPPTESIDHTIGLRESFRRRRSGLSVGRS